MPNLDLTTKVDEWALDDVPFHSEDFVLEGGNFFDERFDYDAPKLNEVFKHPVTGELTPERMAQISYNSLNGSAMMTPGATDKTLHGKVGVNDLDDDQLEGELLVLDLEPGKMYGADDVEALLKDKLEKAKKYIVLFRTGITDQLLQHTDEHGRPNWDACGQIVDTKPGFTVDGAKAFASKGIAKVIMIDSLSFEGPDGGTANSEKNGDGFQASQALMDYREDTGEFVPLVYSVSNTSETVMDSIAAGKLLKPSASLQLGNLPRKTNLPQHPVAVKVRY